MIIYELTHLFHRHNGHLVLEPLMLGFYSSLETIQQAIRYYSCQPGFCNNVDAFSVRQRSVEGILDNNFIFEAVVFIYTDNFEYEHTIDLGIWSNEKSAREALSTFVECNPNLFRFNNLQLEKIVNSYTIDEKKWTEGFTISGGQGDILLSPDERT